MKATLTSTKLLISLWFYQNHSNMDWVLLKSFIT